ncbi:MAG TPA: SDR family oxidoreductase, partial [Verrucomicrobiae bacterium]|nr:SDR family oxidoreductase [Verrucomicrobiae bacterium]
AFGRVDILVNNAGVYEFAPLENVTEEHFHKQFNLNVLGLLLTTQAALNHFNGDGGSVINISSLVSTLAPANAAVYSATKGAVDTITVSLAKELGARKIRVNAVRPGLVETEGAVASGFTQGDFHDQYVRSAPLGRIGRPQDIASAVSYLASDESSWVTGETLLVSGGHR